MTLPDPLRTRDRRDVANARIDPASQEITGEVPMIGACRWRADGRILTTPAMEFTGDHAGPLDLILAPIAAGDGPRHASMAEAMADPAGRNACCD